MIRYFFPWLCFASQSKNTVSAHFDVFNLVKTEHFARILFLICETTIAYRVLDVTMLFVHLHILRLCQTHFFKSKDPSFKRFS